MLAARLAELRAGGGRAVFTNGCFDLLHRGHVECLAAARALGDALVIGLNDDASVRRLKGPSRPVNPVEDRAIVLAALECVTAVVVFATPTPVALIERLRPEVFVKGGDYSVDRLPEAAAVRAYGGEVRILGFVPGRSSTALLDRAAKVR